MNPLVAANSTSSPISQHLLRLLIGASMACCCLLPEASAADSHSVTLAWNPNPESNIAGYRLKYGTAPGVYPVTIEAGNATSASASGLTQGTTYYFVVLAYNTSGQSSSPSAVATYTVPVAPNTPPVANSFPLTVLEDGQASLVLSGSDLESDPLTYSIVSPPSKGTLSGTAPNLTYRPAANANGSDSFAYRVNDGRADSAAATVAITITPVNDPPVAVGRSATTARDTAVPVTVTGTDVEGAALTYAVVTPPAHGSLGGTAPNWIYTPQAGYTGNDQFTFRVNDGSANSSPATVSISVSASNRIPVAQAKRVITMRNKPVAVVLSGTDADSNPLTYRVISPPATGILSGSPPNLHFAPAKRWTGDVSFTYVANDGSVDSVPATVSIRVKGKNRRPVATSAAATVHQNAATSVTLAGTDADEDPLTFQVVRQPANGTVQGTGTSFVYTPNPGFRGRDPFKFIATDGASKSKAATMVLTVVNPNNRAPVALGMTLTAPLKKAVVVELQGTDADGDPLTFRVIDRPAVGKLRGKKNPLKYKPPGKFSGTVSFTYVANDGVLDSAPVTVTITIGEEASAALARLAGVPASPSLSLRALPGPTGSLVLELTGDPGGNYLLETSTNLSKWTEHGTVVIDSDGRLSLEVPVPSGARRGFYRLRTP